MRLSALFFPNSAFTPLNVGPNLQDHEMIADVYLPLR